MIKRIGITLVSALMAFMPTAPVLAESQDQVLTVHFIDVDQGLAVLAQNGEETLLYDGGDRETSSYLISYLQRQGVEEIDYMISSHYDSDHLAGLVGALNVFEVDTVIGSDYVHDTKLYESFYSALDSLDKQIQYPSVGDRYELGDASFTVLAPSEITEDSNENSVAIKLEYGDTSFIITGDAEFESEANMISSGLDLSCDVLVAGHHGSATSSSWEFVEATLPEYVVISCGVDNSYGHPHEETLEKFTSIGSQLFRTDEQGNIVAVSDGEKIQWSVIPSNTYMMYSTANLNVREEPNTNCAILGTFSAGDMIEVAAESDADWLQIVYNNRIAYVSSNYVSEVIPAQIPPTQSVVEQTEAPVIAPSTQAPTQPVELMVWLSATGSKYHRINNCGNMNPAKARQITESDAISQGYGKCKNCW